MQWRKTPLHCIWTLSISQPCFVIFWTPRSTLKTWRSMAINIRSTPNNRRSTIWLRFVYGLVGGQIYSTISTLLDTLPWICSSQGVPTNRGASPAKHGRLFPWQMCLWCVYICIGQGTERKWFFSGVMKYQVYIHCFAKNRRWPEVVTIAF